MHTPDGPRFLASPREGLPPLADSPSAVSEAADALASGTGPVAVDTERASGFRFDDRAWLVQLRRTGAGTHLVDPAAVPDADRLLAPVMNSTPWVLHAAHTDLPALTSLGWHAPELHDTQIAGRLLGYGQIGLAGMLEELLGVTVAKDKGREDWSRRPLTEDLLTYAALDVELLTELLDTAVAQLRRRSIEEGTDRILWYRQECEHVRTDWSHPVTVPDWTRLRGIGAVRDPRGRELARRLTEIRNRVARDLDTPPEKVLASSLIVELARSPQDAEDVLLSRGTGGGRVRPPRSARGGHGRRPPRPMPRMSPDLRSMLLHGVRDALSADPGELPPRPEQVRGVPDHRTWSRDHPVAARLLSGFRDAVDTLSGHLDLDPSELLVSRSVRSLAWKVSTSLSPGPTGPQDDPVGWAEELVGGLLVGEDARPWQIDLLVPVFVPVVDTVMVDTETADTVMVDTETAGD
ncbi:MAG: ribonuclease D [Corynebacterium provencense]|uniref:HRDC domain-containing protein n=1 Tax=Corynebacterium provencense TaxID=1737425 RepID=UPI00298A0207|nr:ribonuclease D [Corynebacterium provencense]